MTAEPRVSIIIPARNEERVLAATLASVQRAGASTGLPCEIIVVDDASEDRTAAIAAEAGARVVSVKIHNIGAVRNAGARQARGDVLVFLDADTLLPEATLQAALRALEAGAVGGGAWVEFDGRITWVQACLARAFAWFWLRLCGWGAGCFLFTRKADFDAIGGFDEQYFCAEERFFSAALKSRGRFVILPESVVTSARKLRLYSTGRLFWIGLRTLCTGKQRFRQREGLEILYDAPRETG